MKTWYAIFLALALLLQPTVEARRGGGGFSRGNSGGRAQPSNPSHGSNVHPQQPSNNFHPQQSNNNNFNRPQQPTNVHPQGGFHPGFQSSPPHFNANGMGSQRSSSNFKSALAGAAVGAVGGIIAYEAGKAIIKSATTPFHHGNNDYYFDRANYRGPTDVPVCHMPLQQLLDASATATTTVAPTTTTAGNGTEGAATTVAPTTTQNPNQVLQNAQFPDGSKPKEVVWNCKRNEMCCGTDCCPIPPPTSSAGGSGGGGGASATSIIFGLLIFLLLLACCCCFAAYCCCKETIENLMPGRSDKYESGQSYPMESYPNGQQSQQYPNQQYSNQQYPQQYSQQPYGQNTGYPPAQNLYPQQPYVPPTYPNHPGPQY